ncbi:hypothetical protein V2J09_002319 [Rumex salicifolius]
MALSFSYLLEYEKLNAICFSCGHFGHFQPYCPTDPENIRKKEEALKKEAGNPNPARRRPVGDEQRGGWMLPKKPVWATRTNAMGKQQKGHSAPNSDSDGQKVARNQGIKGGNSGSQPKPIKEVVKEKSPKNDKVWKEVKPKYKSTTGGSAHNLETEAELVEKDCRAEEKNKERNKKRNQARKVARLRKAQQLDSSSNGPQIDGPVGRLEASPAKRSRSAFDFGMGPLARYSFHEGCTDQHMFQLPPPTVVEVLDDGGSQIIACEMEETMGVHEGIQPEGTMVVYSQGA